MFNDQSTSTTFGAMLLIINRVLIGSASLQASLSTSLFTCRNNDLPRLSCRRRTQQSKVLIPLHALKHSTDQCMHSLLGVSSQVLARLAYVRLVPSGGIPNVGHLIELARPVFFYSKVTPAQQSSGLLRPVFLGPLGVMLVVGCLQACTASSRGGPCIG